MKKLLALIAVVASTATASAGVINVYEPDATGNPHPGQWTVAPSFASAIHINSISADAIDFTYVGSAKAARTQYTAATLDVKGNNDDFMQAFQHQGNASIRVTVNSYDNGSGGPDFWEVGTPEIPGLNFMISIPLQGGGADDIYLDSSSAPVPAPSTAIMIVTGAVGLVLRRVVRRQK